MIKPKVIGILQPVYLPWMGYFEQIAYVDQFIFMDDAQYTKHDWRNRNRIKTANGSIWLTVPIKRAPLGTMINRIEINYQQSWIKKHLHSIEYAYRKRPYFQPLFNDMREVLESRPTRLVDLDVKMIELICKYLDISTPVGFSSEVPRDKAKRDIFDSEKNSVKNNRVLEICKYYNAKVFYEGQRGSDYIDTELFHQHGIEVVFQDYQHPRYQQAFGEFIPYQSTIDLVMNTGPEASMILKTSPVPDKLVDNRVA